MPDPLIITFPGSAFRAQILSVQRIVSRSVKENQPLPIERIMQYVNLTTANHELEKKLIDRGDLTPDGDILWSVVRYGFTERMYDTGDQLKEVKLKFPKKIGIKVSEPVEGELIMDFTAGEDILFSSTSLPDATGFSESFIMERIRFHPQGNQTVLRERYGDGVIHLLVDYTRAMDEKLMIRYGGNSFKSMFLNTLSATFVNSECCGGPIPRQPVGNFQIPVHVKVIYPPTMPYQDQIRKANEWMVNYDLELVVKSYQSLQHLTQFQVVDLSLPGTSSYCMSGQSSAEQRELFINYRGGIPSNEIVIYFVYATTPSLAGCASYPIEGPGYPSVVVIANASNFTLPHELCHVMGLNHVDDNNRLMTGNGTFMITNPPPDLVPTELTRIKNSKFVRKIS